MAAWVAAESVKIWQSTQHLHPDRMEVGERTDDFGLGGEDSNSAFGFQNEKENDNEGASESVP